MGKTASQEKEKITIINGQLSFEELLLFYATRVQLERRNRGPLFPHSPSAFWLANLTKSNLVVGLGDYLTVSGNPERGNSVEVDRVVCLIEEGVPRRNPARSAHFSALGDQLVHLINSGNDREGKYKETVLALSRMDQVLPGGIGYFLNLAGRVVNCFNIEGAGKILAEMFGGDPDCMEKIFRNQRRFGIGDDGSFYGGEDLKEKWETFSLPHLKSFLPFLEKIRQIFLVETTPSPQWCQVVLGIRHYGLQDFFSCLGVIGDSISAFLRAPTQGLPQNHILFFTIPFKEEVAIWLYYLLRNSGMAVPLGVVLEQGGISYRPIIKMVEAGSEVRNFNLLYARGSGDFKPKDLLRVEAEQMAIIGIPLALFGPQQWVSENSFTQRFGFPPTKLTQLLELANDDINKSPLT